MLSGRGKSFSYDGLNRPVQIVTPAQTVGFAYGPDDQRLTKTVSGAVTLYLGADEEITASGQRIKHPSANVCKVGSTLNWLPKPS
jgi:YD repeat-containing protein